MSKLQKAALVNVRQRRNRIRYVFSGRDELDQPFTFSIVALEQRDIDAPTVAKVEVRDEAHVPLDALIESLRQVERNELTRAGVREPATPLELNLNRF